MKLGLDAPLRVKSGTGCDGMAQEHAAQIDELVNYGFGPFSLSQGAIKQLKEIAVFAVVKDLFLEDVTGLVFGGYGDDDRYPLPHQFRCQRI